MSRKKTAIRASFIQCSRLRPPTLLCQNFRYCGPIAEFVSASESAVQTISRFPPDRSESKNLLNVLDSALGTMSVHHSPVRWILTYLTRLLNLGVGDAGAMGAGREEIRRAAGGRAMRFTSPSPQA